MATLQRIDVNPAVLQWALDSVEAPRPADTEQRTAVLEWISGDKQPTPKQLAGFAKLLAVPFGYLLLEKPPALDFVHAYFRKGYSANATQLSATAKAIVRDTEKKSEWAEDYLRELGIEPLPFVGSARFSDPPEEVAQTIRRVVGYESTWTRYASSWNDARLGLIAAIEEAGVHVVASSVVGNNSHRKVAPEELNGFTIVQSRAPFIFVNTADSVARQIFTLAHELAQVWTGTGALDLTSFEA